MLKPYSNAPQEVALYGKYKASDEGDVCDDVDTVAVVLGGETCNSWFIGFLDACSSCRR